MSAHLSPMKSLNKYELNITAISNKMESEDSLHGDKYIKDETPEFDRGNLTNLNTS